MTGALRPIVTFFLHGCTLIIWESAVSHSPTLTFTVEVTCGGSLWHLYCPELLCWIAEKRRVKMMVCLDPGSWCILISIRGLLFFSSWAFSLTVRQVKLQVRLKYCPNVTFTSPFLDIETDRHSSEVIRGKRKSVNNTASSIYLF